jgi:hypothetical protein
MFYKKISVFLLMLILFSTSNLFFSEAKVAKKTEVATVIKTTS